MLFSADNGGGWRGGREEEVVGCLKGLVERGGDRLERIEEGSEEDVVRVCRRTDYEEGIKSGEN